VPTLRFLTSTLVFGVFVFATAACHSAATAEPGFQVPSKDMAQALRDYLAELDKEKEAARAELDHLLPPGAEIERADEVGCPIGDQACTVEYFLSVDPAHYQDIAAATDQLLIAHGWTAAGTRVNDRAASGTYTLNNWRLKYQFASPSSMGRMRPEQIRGLVLRNGAADRNPPVAAAGGRLRPARVHSSPRCRLPGSSPSNRSACRMAWMRPSISTAAAPSCTSRS
jgi:hypothetical protein